MINRVRNDIKQAMISKDEMRKNTLRLVLGNAQLEAKEAHVEMTDAHLLSAFNKELKQTNQALDILKEKNQMEGKFYEDTIKKIEIIKEYLPKQLSEDEIANEVRKLIVGVDKTNKGQVMKAVMSSALKNRASGKIINQVVMKVLAEG